MPRPPLRGEERVWGGAVKHLLTMQIPSTIAKSTWYSSWVSQGTTAAFKHSQLGLHFSQFLRHQSPHADAPTALKLDTHFPLIPHNTFKQAKALPSHQTEREHLLPASLAPGSAATQTRNMRGKGAARALPGTCHVPDTCSEPEQHLARHPHLKPNPAPSGATSGLHGQGEQQLLDPAARAQKGVFQVHC